MIGEWWRGITICPECAALGTDAIPELEAAWDSLRKAQRRNRIKDEHIKNQARRLAAKSEEIENQRKQIERLQAEHPVEHELKKRVEKLEGLLARSIHRGQAAEAERDQWRANHDAQVNIKRKIQERYDALLRESKSA